MAAVDEVVHQRDHLGDVPGGPRLVGDGEDAEGVEGRGGQPLVAVRQGVPGLTGLGALAQDLVVDVGDVADDGHVVPVAGLQPATQDVEGHGEPDVPDVGRPLGGEATDVDAHASGFEGLEVAQGTRGRVVEAQGHRAEFIGAAGVALTRHYADRHVDARGPLGDTTGTSGSTRKGPRHPGPAAGRASWSSFPERHLADVATEVGEAVRRIERQARRAHRCTGSCTSRRG